MTLVPSLEEKKDPLNAGVLHPLFALALAKQGGLGGVFRSWQGSLLHSMKCKWGPITKHVGVSLVSLSERSVCARARPGLEEGGSGGNGALWMVAPHCLQTQCYNGREVDLWASFLSQLWMLIPRTSHSAGSVGNSQSELPREKHHRIVIFPNKFIERKSEQMLPRRFQKPLKTTGLALLGACFQLGFWTPSDH